jgi:hypothetical protein
MEGDGNDANRNSNIDNTRTELVDGSGSSRRLYKTRVLDRQGAYCQSRGRWSVQHVSRNEARQFYYNRSSNDASNRNITSRRSRSRRLPRHKSFGIAGFTPLSINVPLSSC